MPRKLGEALARRAELQARMGEVRDRLRVSALAQGGRQIASVGHAESRTTRLASLRGVRLHRSAV